MKQRALEERLAALEKQMGELQAAVDKIAQPKDWRSTIGMFAGDEVMRRINEAALQYREADRKKARRRYARKQRAKS